MCINTFLPYILLFLLHVVYVFVFLLFLLFFYFSFAVKHIGQQWVVINSAI